MSKTIFACVLWGNKFNVHHVLRLNDMVELNYKLPYEFWVLTDAPNNNYPNHIKTAYLPLEPEMDKWWNKMALFEKGMFPDGAHVIYLDLDVVIQNDITKLTNWHTSGSLLVVQCIWKQVILREQGYNVDDPTNSYNCDINSSVMVWIAGELDHVWEYFVDEADHMMTKYRGIDRMLFHEPLIPLNYIPRGIVYSRLFGVHENKRGPRRTSSNSFDLFYEPTYQICLFNGWGRTKNANNGVHLDNTAYNGFEMYWGHNDRK